MCSSTRPFFAANGAVSRLGNRAAEVDLARLGSINEELTGYRVVADESFFTTWAGAYLEPKLGRCTNLELGDNLQCFASGADGIETEGASGFVDQPVLIKVVITKPRRSLRSSGIGVWTSRTFPSRFSRLTSRKRLCALRQGEVGVEFA